MFKKFNLVHTLGLEEVLKSIICENGNNLVDVTNVDNFFSEVLSQNEKLMEIKNLATQQQKQYQLYGNTKEEIVKQLGCNFNLEIKVIEVNDDSDIPTSFQVGQTFLITPSGLPESKRYCHDGTVIFGRASPDNKDKADIFFNSKDMRISRFHCQIISKHQGYFLVDQGSNQGTYLKITQEKPLQIAKNMILDIGDQYMVRVIECINEKGIQQNPDNYLTLEVYNPYQGFEGSQTETGIQTIRMNQKGKQQKSIQDELNEIEMMQTIKKRKSQIVPKLVLNFQDRQRQEINVELEANQQMKEFLIGRKVQQTGAKNIQLNGNKISRLHAKIIYDDEGG